MRRISSRIPPLRAAALTGLLLGLAACVDADGMLPPSTRVDRAALAQAAARCETEGGAHWLMAHGPITNLIYIGAIWDPATTGGRLVPIGDRDGYSAHSDTFAWKALPGIQYVDAPVTTMRDAPPHPEMYFGPVTGQPTGLYRYRFVTDTAPECDAWRRHPTQIQWPGRQCEAFAYAGPFDIDAPGDDRYLYVSYSTSAGTGINVFVEEIRHGPHTVVARSVIYGAASHTPACFTRVEKSDIKTLFTQAP